MKFQIYLILRIKMFQIVNNKLLLIQNLIDPNQTIQNLRKIHQGYEKKA